MRNKDVLIFLALMLAAACISLLACEGTNRKAELTDGMILTVEIQAEDVLTALSADCEDPVFNQALGMAREWQETYPKEDYTTRFTRAYRQLGGEKKLAYIFNSYELRDLINPSSSDDKVIEVLREEIDAALLNTINVLRNRIDRMGIKRPTVERIDNSDRILIELPRVREPQRIRNLLQKTASFEFWPTYDNTEIFPMLMQANELLRDIDNGQAPAQDGDLFTVWTQNNPLFIKMTPIYASGSGRAMSGPVIGHAMSEDTATVNKYFKIRGIKALLPHDLKPMWSRKPIDNEENVFELYAIKANTRDGKAPLDGSSITDARVEISGFTGMPEVNMAMNSMGSKIWARLTGDNIGQNIAIVMDEQVFSAPLVNSQITGGRSQITGNFTNQEANDLANVLRSGKLPVTVCIIQETLVGHALQAQQAAAN